MAHPMIVAGGVGALVLLVLQIVCTATPHWIDIVYTGDGGEGFVVYVGILQSCIGTTLLQACFAIGSTSTVSVSFHEIAAIALNLIACVLLLVSTFVAFIGCTNNNKPQQSTAVQLSGLGFGAGGSILIAAIWYYSAVIRFVDAYLSITTDLDTTVGYSFILSVVTGVCCLICATILAVTSCRMQQPVPTAQVPMQNMQGNPHIVVNTGYVQGGPPQYPQVVQGGYPAGGYPQAVPQQGISPQGTYPQARYVKQ